VIELPLQDESTMTYVVAFPIKDATVAIEGSDKLKIVKTEAVDDGMIVTVGVDSDGALDAAFTLVVESDSKITRCEGHVTTAVQGDPEGSESTIARKAKVVESIDLLARRGKLTTTYLLHTLERKSSGPEGRNLIAGSASGPISALNMESDVCMLTPSGSGSGSGVDFPAPRGEFAMTTGFQSTLLNPRMHVQARKRHLDGNKREADLGLVRGKAGEKSCDVVHVEFPVEYRAGMKVEVRDELNCLTVKDIRGNGPWADITLEVNSRRSGERPFSMTLTGSSDTIVRARGMLNISRPDPFVLGLQTVCGGSVSTKCAIQEEFATDKKFEAFFEPKLKEFWLSRNKGVIPAGAKEFPFSIFFAPRDMRPNETLLIVECEDVEMCVKVCGSTGGFEGRRWGGRRARNRT
jgi:hypothetical protein